MKVNKIITRTTTKEETVDRLCNKCGESLIPKNSEVRDSESETFQSDYYGLVDVTVAGGYFSPHLQDDIQYEFDLCEGCLVELFKTFKYPAYRGSYMGHNYNSEDEVINGYSKEQLEKYIEELNNQPSKTVEDLKMLDELEEILEIKEKIN